METIAAWAHCTLCSDSYGSRSHDKRIQVRPEDTYTNIRRGCPDCKQTAKMYVAGPVISTNL